MQQLDIEPVVPFVLGPGDITVVLVGCGGTGSHIAQSLARIAAHLSGTPKALHMIFMDGDTVEAKNVGRQLFSAADIGQNKATALGERFNQVFGLSIGVVPAMATKTNLAMLATKGNRTRHTILVGAVDTAAARSVLAQHMLKHRAAWLDCGNHEYSGQVAFGTTAKATELHGAVQMNICAALPAPHLVYPSLLEKAPVRRRADCAAAMEDNLQSLMVNQAMAAVAAQYLYALIMQRRLTTFTTTIDLQSLAMRSTPVTASQIAAATNVPRDLITGERKERKAA